MAEAVVLPGRTFGPAAGLLMYAGAVAERRGAAVQRHGWSQQPPNPFTPGIEDWVRDEVGPVLDAIGGNPMLIGKSLGTNAAAVAAERTLPAVWLTPVLNLPWVAELISPVRPSRRRGLGLRPTARQNAGVPRPVPADLLEIAEALVPGTPLGSARLAEHGNMHHVVLFPGVAAVRISRRPDAAAELPRRVEILRAVAAAGLPFAVPEPLTAVTAFGERAAVAVSWIDGAGLPEGTGNPVEFGLLFEALRQVEISAELAAVLREPRRYADGLGWADILDEIVPRLPTTWRAGVRRRLDTLLALEDVPARLVHGDLGGSNVHFGADGKLTGVLDWDMATRYDPAIDAALVATWHGWDVLRAATDEETYRRARAWDDVVGVGHLHAVFAGRPLSHVDGFVGSVVAWLEERSSAGQAFSSR